MGTVITINSMEPSPSLTAGSHSAGQKMTCLLWNWKVTYSVHKTVS